MTCVERYTKITHTPLTTIPTHGLVGGVDGVGGVGVEVVVGFRSGVDLGWQRVPW